MLTLLHLPPSPRFVAFRLAILALAVVGFMALG
jgi:hypothetical protein